MLGIVLWYNAEKRIGLVWCEDQGPLAYLGPEVDLPSDCAGLDRGAQIRFLVAEADGFRTVVHIESTIVVPTIHAPDALLYKHRPTDRKLDAHGTKRPNLRIVA